MKPTSRQSASISSTALLALLGGALASPSPGTIYTVGAGGPPCTHATIELALTAAAGNAGPDEVRIASNQAYTNQYHHLTDWSPATKGAVTIRGGFDDCADTTPGANTAIFGQPADPVFEIDTVAQPTSEVTLRDLTIRDSGESGVVVAGGGRVDFLNATLLSNGQYGLLVAGGAEAFLDVDSEVAQNSVGIGCVAATVDVAAWVHDNSGIQGGGIFATSACQLNVLSQAWIVLNDAWRGGGIFANSGSDVVVDGTNSGFFATQIDGNSAFEGGGIYAIDAGTTVTIRNARVTGNEAESGGAGIYAYDNASVVMERVDGGCWDPSRCSDLSSNTVTEGIYGAAAIAQNGADLSIFQTFVDSNSILVESSSDSVFWVVGTGSTLTLEGVGFWNNQGPDVLIDGINNAILQVAFVSATGNFYGEGKLPASPIALSAGATGTLASSIFYPNSPVLGGAALTLADCLILSNTSGIPPGAKLITIADPLFLNPAGGNLHLPPNSPAVDYCDDFFTVPQHSDIDHEVREFDLAANPNGAPGAQDGTFDIGFDEHRGLFGDGFETGTTGPWSLTVP